jgi:hypothetical protein
LPETLVEFAPNIFGVSGKSNENFVLLQMENVKIYEPIVP